MKRNKILVFSLILIMVLVSSVVGCAPKEVEKKIDDEVGEVAPYWEPTPDNPYNGVFKKADGSPLRAIYLCDQTAGTWMVINTAFTKSLIERGGGSLTIFDAKQDGAAEIAAFEDAITAGYDVIILHPVSSFATAPLADKAAALGIDLYTQMIPVYSDSIIHHVSTSQKEMGYQCGKYLVEYFKAKGEPGIVLEVWGGLGMELAEYRHEGFREAIEGSPWIEKIYETPETKWRDEDAMQFTLELLEAYPEINAIYSHSDCMLGGVVEAVKMVGRYVLEGEKGYLPIVSIDAVPWVLKEIEKGYIAGSVEDNPALYADITVKAIIKHTILGMEVPKETIIPAKLITKDNLHEAADWENVYVEGRYDKWPIFDVPHLIETPTPEVIK